MIRSILNKMSTKNSEEDEGSRFAIDHNGGYNREKRTGLAYLQAFTGSPGQPFTEQHIKLTDKDTEEQIHTNHSLNAILSPSWSLM